MSLTRILVGIDFSPASFETARWVARYLGAGAELVLAHVIAMPEPPPIVRNRFPRRELVVETLRAGADRRLRELSASLPPGRVWLEIREGVVRTTLLAIAHEYAVDLLAVGAHGERPGVTRALGSTAEHLVRMAEVPVLLVAGAMEPGRTRILAAVDDAATAAEALRWAGRLGETLDADVTTLHVVPSGVMTHVLEAAALATGNVTPGPTATGGERAADDRWLEVAVHAGVPRERVTTEAAFGEPGQEIVAAADRLGAGIIVMGRRGAGGVRRAVLGSVVDAVLRHAPCPVLVVPERGRAPGG